jgi:hypothetical protein
MFRQPSIKNARRCWEAAGCQRLALDICIFGQTAMNASSSKRTRWGPPSDEKPLVASRTSEGLESDARESVKRHPTERRNESGYRRVKKTNGHHCDYKYDWRVAQECEEG